MLEPESAVLEDLPDQREAVGVQSGGRQAEHDVAGPDQAGTQQPVGLHHPGGRAGQVELVWTEMPGMFGRLAPDQRAARLHAAFGYSRHDLGDALGHDLPADDVVGHVERLGAANHQIVDDHADQIDPDGAVAARPLGDQHLGAHAVGCGREQRAAHRAQPGRVEQPGETADPADYRRDPRSSKPPRASARRRAPLPRCRRQMPRNSRRRRPRSFGQAPGDRASRACTCPVRTR